MHSNRFQLAAPPGLFRPGQPEDSSGGSDLARACSSNKHVGMGDVLGLSRSVQGWHFRRGQGLRVEFDLDQEKELDRHECT